MAGGGVGDCGGGLLRSLFGPHASVAAMGVKVTRRTGRKEPALPSPVTARPPSLASRRGCCSSCFTRSCSGDRRQAARTQGLGSLEALAALEGFDQRAAVGSARRAGAWTAAEPAANGVWGPAPRIRAAGGWAALSAARGGGGWSADG